jgi:hypothetical protein
VDVESDPSALAIDGGTLWVANEGDNVISRLRTAAPK